jgi:phosphoglycerate kinase
VNPEVLAGSGRQAAVGAAGSEVELAEDVVGESAAGRGALATVRWRCWRTSAYEPGRSPRTTPNGRAGRPLRSFGDVFVSDGFGVVHRKQASVYDVAKRLPNAAGSWCRPRSRCSAAHRSTAAPVRRGAGGAKVSDKLAVIANLIKTADTW